MDLFIVWNYRRSIDCYTVLGARHSRTFMAKPNLFLLAHGGNSYWILEESVPTFLLSKKIYQVLDSVPSWAVHIPEQ